MKIELFFWFSRFLSVDFLILFRSFAVSFSGNEISSRNEPVSLSNMDRDCFVIPVLSLERFLPAGVPVNIHIFSFFSLIFQIVFIVSPKASITN